MKRRTLFRYQAAMVAVVAAVSLAGNARLDAPPRYDGAGYAVLARSLQTGLGYREIDHPDSPRHAHFPPGYPLALAGLWGITGFSNPAAHLLSIACTIGAVVLALQLFQAWFGSRIGLIMGLTLAINWRWGRDGSAIQSEPVFSLLCLTILWISRRFGSSSKIVPAIFLGVLLGLCVLVRHVGACVVAAVFLDRVGKKQTQAAIVAGITAGIVVSPWIAWMATVGHQTQVELLPGRNLPQVLVENAVFYLRRLPDQIVGPVIEVATVFRPSWRVPATILAAIVSGIILWGWIRVLRSPRKRIASLIPLVSLGLLLVWPFTEAGRFLVPLVPFVMIGMMEGLGRILSKAGVKRGRTWASAMILAGSIPYPVYAIASGRSEAGRRSHEAFDHACRWIDSQRADGTILTRHPGEAFLLSQRRGISPPEGASPEIIATWIEKYHVAFLLIDEARFANAPTTPLELFVVAFPHRVERVYGEGLVVVYRVVGLTDWDDAGHNP